MKTTASLCLPLVLLAVASIAPARAADLPGLQFAYGDWEIACDNTRTCRAAGYYADNSGEESAGNAEPMRVSVLLTRKAGPNTPVTAALQIGSYEDSQPATPLPPTLALTMKVNGRAHGKVVMDKRGRTADLAPSQTQALLAALTRVSRIEWTDGTHIWRLSDAGAAAVLLKMDEFQGRIGTPGALVRKGAKGEGSALPALPPPVVVAAAVDDAAVALSRDRLALLRKALEGQMEECSDAVDADGVPAEISLQRLSGGKLLASMPCWRAAYNQGDSYWVINAAPPYAPELVTSAGSGYAGGTIEASQKGRGLGDCWSFDAWTWDGRRFVHTSEGTTGDCRLVAPGGAWSLPVLVTTVGKPAPAARR